MHARDRRRRAAARRKGRTTVLFTRRPAWERALRRNLSSAVAFFYNLDEVDPAQFDLVVPLSIEAQQQVHEEHPGLLGSTALVPSPATMALCDDKLLFARHLVDSGLGHVVPRLGPDLEFPFVLKPRVGAWGTGTTIVEDCGKALKFAGSLESDEYFTQASVPGTKEYTTHFVARDGFLRYARTLEFTFDRSLYVKGAALAARGTRQVDHRRFDELLSEIVGAVDYSGFGCINYKLVDETPQVFEVNPRVGGSMYHFVKPALEAYRAALGD